MTYINELFDIKQTRMAGLLSMRESFEYRSTVVRSAGRQEQVVSRSADYYFSTDIGDLILDDCDVDYANAFFQRMRGKLHGFRYKSLIDNSASEIRYYPIPSDTDVWQQGVCVSADPSQQVGQLAKLYHVLNFNSYKYITKPRPGTVQIFVAGSPHTPLEIDYENGIVTFEFPVNFDQVTARFEYDLPVHFDRDDLPNAVLVDSSFVKEADPVLASFINNGKSVFQISSLTISEDLRAAGAPGIVVPPNPFLYVDLRFNDLTDSAGTIQTLTASGNAGISSVQFKEAPGSLIVLNQGDQVVSSADLIFTNSNSIDPNTSCTFGFWVYPIGWTVSSRFVTFVESGLLTPWSVGYNPDGVGSKLAFGQPVVGQQYYFGQDPIVGQWNHIAVSLKRTTAFFIAELRLFFNGNLVSTSLGAPVVLTSGVQFGSSETNRKGNCYIDKFVILKGNGAAQLNNFSPNLPPWS